MSISWIKCLPKKGRNNLDLLSIQSEDIKRIINDKIDRQASQRLTETTPCINACFDDPTSYALKNYGISNANTISDMNISNVFEHNPDMVRASSFIWPEVEMDHRACTGHECLVTTDCVNNVILYQRRQPKGKTFTPPLFPETGIAICPEPNPVEYVEEKPSPAHQTSVLEDDIYYKTPGNMEFIEFTYPIIGHKWRYTTYAVPINRTDWEWIYNYIRSIRNLFRRKYLCDLLLSSEPGQYKGQVAYLVKFESETQRHILQCRSGLPKCLKEILVIPANAHNDIECFVSEYLIKRKYVFRTIRNQEGPQKPENKRIEMNNLQIQSQSALDPPGKESTLPDSLSKTEAVQKQPQDIKEIKITPPIKNVSTKE